jgi:hypothetical protein
VEKHHFALIVAAPGALCDGAPCIEPDGPRIVASYMRFRARSSLTPASLAEGDIARAGFCAARARGEARQ